MIVLLVHFTSCAFMTGLIWTIQILHYPAFAHIREDRFISFHFEHSRNISFIVGPIMLVELASAILLLFYFPGEFLLWGNGALLFLIWGCTFFLSVPLHGLLGKSQDSKVINRLVSTNWPRTLFWSLRLLMMFYFVVHFTRAENGHIIN